MHHAGTHNRNNRALTINWAAMKQVVVVCIVILALLAFIKRNARGPKWSSTSGTIRDTRIVADRGLETKWGAQVSWKAEYSVTYYVGERQFTAWTDSGIRGDNKSEVQLALPKTHSPCQVRYDPVRPELSVADCP